MFGSLGGPELFLILVIALIVFGPRKLPEIGKSLGKMMMEFKKASNEFRQTIETEVEADKQREATRAAAVAEAPAASPSLPPAAAGTTHHEEAEIPSAGASVSREAPPPPVAPK